MKDPFLAADAARLLPSASRVRIEHIGAALSDDMRVRAEHEGASNPRWRWLGARTRRETLRAIAAADVLVVTSRSEGGPSVVAEALMASTPVLSTRIDGSLGMLGADYPGRFPVGDARALAELLQRVEADARFMAELARACAARRPHFERGRERAAWAALLADLGRA